MSALKSSARVATGTIGGLIVGIVVATAAVNPAEAKRGLESFVDSISKSYSNLVATRQDLPLPKIATAVVERKVIETPARVQKEPEPRVVEKIVERIVEVPAKYDSVTQVSRGLLPQADVSQEGYSFYCRPSRGYYPNIQTCSEKWTQVSSSR